MKEVKVGMESASCILLIEGVTSEKYVLLVDNIEEKHARGSGIKPAGWGIPGGGQEKGETSLQAAERELQNETGVVVKESARSIVTRRKLHVFDEGTGEYRPQESRWIDDRMKIFEKSGVEQMLEVRHIFLVSLAWDDPALAVVRQLLLKKGRTTAQKELVLNFNKLTAEEIDSLGIVEKDEIRGIGIFPFSALLNRDGGAQEYVYPGHIQHIRIGLEEAGIIPKRPPRVAPPAQRQ